LEHLKPDLYSDKIQIPKNGYSTDTKNWAIKETWQLTVGQNLVILLS